MAKVKQQCKHNGECPGTEICCSLSQDPLQNGTCKEPAQCDTHYSKVPGAPFFQYIQQPLSGDTSASSPGAVVEQDLGFTSKNVFSKPGSGINKLVLCGYVAGVSAIGKTFRKCPSGYQCCLTNPGNKKVGECIGIEHSETSAFVTEHCAGGYRPEDKLLWWAAGSSPPSGQTQMPKAAVKKAQSYAPGPKWQKIKTALDKVSKKLETSGRSPFPNAAQFDAQCFLMHNLEQITEWSKGVRQPPLIGAGVGPNHYGFWQKDNYRIRCLDAGSNTQHVGASTFMSELTANGDMRELFHASPHKFSGLYPRIRLYKTVRDKNGILTDIPIGFSDHTSAKSVSDITSGRQQRGDDIGLKSFSFEFRNNNIAFAKRLVTVKLSFILQSASTLLEIQHLDLNDKKLSFKFVDLFLAAATRAISVATGAGDVYDGESFTIRAEAGWEVPTDKTNNLGKRFREQIKKASVNMFLTLNDYDLRFQENGMLGVDLSYHSYIEGAFESSDYDIFINKEGSKLLDRINEHEKLVKAAFLQKEHEQRQAEAKVANYKRSLKALEEEAIKQQVPKLELVPGYGQLVDGLERAIQERNDAISPAGLSAKDKQDALAQLEEYRDFLEADKQKTILETHRDLLGTLVVNRKIHWVDVPNKDLFIWVKSPEEKSSQIRLRVDKRNPPTVDSFKTTGSGKDLESDYLDTYVKALEKSINEDSTKKIKKSLESAGQGLDTAVFNPASAPNAQMRRIHFIFFGDIINALLSANAKVPMGSSFSSMSQDNGGYITKLLKHGNIEIVLGPAELANYHEPGNVFMSNIGDIPISMEHFLNWYHRDIIMKQVSSYTLMNFIQAIIKNLIIPILSPKCNRLIRDANKYKINLRVISSPGIRVKKPVGDKPAVYKSKLAILDHTHGFAGRITLDEFRKAVGIRRSKNTLSEKERTKVEKHGTTSLNEIVSSHVASEHHYHYVVIYLESAPTHRLKGNYEEDFERGVYHLAVGSDVGLVKSISFRKMKLKYAPQINIENARDRGKTNQQLWLPFNARIRMIGNAIFRPGNLIYINPLSMGMGTPSDPQSVGNKLMLGGYYLIISSDNSISSGGWESDVQAIRQNSLVAIDPRTEKYFKLKDQIFQNRLEEQEAGFFKIPGAANNLPEIG